MIMRRAPTINLYLAMSSQCCAATGDTRPLPCRRQWPQGRPSGYPRKKVICADKICASIIKTDTIDTTVLTTNLLSVAGEAHTGRLVVGSMDAAEEPHQTLAVRGDVLVDAALQGSATALLLRGGDLVLSGTSSSTTVLLASKNRASPLALDIIHDDEENFLRFVADTPSVYWQRGKGIQYETKHVQSFVGTYTDADALGCLETRVLSGVVLQTLWAPSVALYESGMFHRTSVGTGAWGAWRHVAADLVL